MISRWIIFGCFLFLFGCSEKQDPPSVIPYSHFNQPVINTGYYAYDLLGVPIREIGFPNTFREVDTDRGRIEVYTFPNPAWIWDEDLDTVTWLVNINGPISTSERKAVLVRANYQDGPMPLGATYNGNLHQVLNDSLVIWEGIYNTVFGVEIPLVGEGDYRLYLDMGDFYLYDNLAVREFLTY